jgi:hypothetical protein
MEQYDTNNSQCASAVTAYVSGWVSELHLKGYSTGAGVYANPDNAGRDIWNALPKADEIWIAKWDGRATIWNLGTTSVPFADSI